MTIRNRTDLKGLFQTNDVPNGTDFGDLIDSFISIADTTAQTVNSDINFTGNISINRLFATSVTAGNIQALSVIVSGDATIKGLLLRSVNSTFSATGTAQASAALLNREINRVTTVTSANNAVILPDFAGAEIIVFNDTATTARIYPPSGGLINNLSTNAAYTINPSAKAVFYSVTAGAVQRYFSK